MGDVPPRLAALWHHVVALPHEARFKRGLHCLYLLPDRVPKPHGHCPV